MYWLDATASADDSGHRRRLSTLGCLLALSVLNACRLPVQLPDLFFRWLLLGDRGFEPSVEVSSAGFPRGEVWPGGVTGRDGGAGGWRHQGGWLGSWRG